MDLRVEQAGPDDAPALLRLREEAEELLLARGIDQWHPGEVVLERVAQQVEDKEWHLVRSGGQVVAGLRLLWSDEPVWQERNAPAAYVHGLVVARRHAGQGLGARLLAWAEDRASAAGLGVVRLDCAETNQVLRRYYASLGFVRVGRRDFEGHWLSAVLLEKHLRRAEGS